MKKYIFLSLFSIAVFALVFGGVNILRAQTAEPVQQNIAGGPCFYKSFKGTCTITAIPSESDISVPSEGLTYKNIVFKFAPIETLDLTNTWFKEADITGKDQGSQPRSIGMDCLTAIYPITSESLTKCGVKVGAVFGCSINLITSGTCTPMGFDFEEIPKCRNENYGCSVDPIPCCTGLKAVSLASLDSSGRCIAAPCGSICLPCGNGICDKNENVCNCSEDCKTTPACADSDGGKDYYVKGTATVGSVSKTDSCINVINTCPEGEGVACSPSFIGVLEYYCENNQIKSETIPCSDCKDGACVKEKSLTLTSPNGGEAWEMGKNYTIKWSSQNLPAGNDIYIWLMIDVPDSSGIRPAMQKNIASELSNNINTYTWTVPATDQTIYPSNNYFIKVAYNVQGPTQQVGDISDSVFSIVKSTGITCTDSDGGKDYEVRGITTAGSVTRTDDCVCEAFGLEGAPPVRCTVVEYYCEGNEVKSETYVCPSGSTCKEGACTKVEAKSLTLTSPNGGEQWGAGKTYDITWVKSGFANEENLNIQLVNYEYGLKCLPRTLSMGEDISSYSKCGPFIYKIASDVQVNKGIYSWTVPSTIGQSRTYKVRIETKITGVAFPDQYKIADSASNTATSAGTSTAVSLLEPSIPPISAYYSDESDNYFSITKPTTCTDSDGGKDYYVKGTVTKGDVSECLSSSTGQTVCPAAAAIFTDECGYCTGACLEGSTCPPVVCGAVKEYYCEGNEVKSETYVCPAGSTCKDGACTKVEKSLTLISPNGGEQWQVGKTYDITWKAPSYKRLGISLWKGIPIGEASGVHEVTNWGIVPEVSATAGKYSWTVPTNLKSGADYFVRIYNLDDVGYDTSDNYFSITETTLDKTKCSQSSDCYASCSLGCVNKDWYKSSALEDCLRVPDYTCECKEGTCQKKQLETCDQKCKDLGYKSGICKSFAVSPEGFKEKEEFEKTHTHIGIGETSDCYLPKGWAGVSKGCYCPRKIECHVFVDCVSGYFPVNTGKIDESGCPIIICAPKPSPSPIPTPGCQTDEDCQTGGCSGELCFKKGLEVSSICLWKPEYECLKKIGCKCIENKCQWQKIEEFSECLGKISEAEENRLIKVPGKPDIYVIKNGKLHHVPSWKAFVASGYKMEEVKQVEEEEIVKRAIVNLIRIPDDPKVYIIGKGQVRHIPNPEVFNSYGFKWGDIVTVSPTELKEYGQANLIRGIGEAKVYLIENGQKRWIETAEAFQKKGYDWSKITEVNKTELDVYSTGAEIIK